MIARPILSLVLLLIVLPSTAAAQKLVIFVRHAERADGGPIAGQMTPPSQQDPPLSGAGTQRAARLATMFADAGIKAIFATEFRRTQETAAPLAAKLGLKVQSMIAKDHPALVKRLQSVHANDIVLIVGHSNTIPQVIRLLGGPAVTIADDDYDSIFVLVPADGTLTRIKY